MMAIFTRRTDRLKRLSRSFPHLPLSPFKWRTTRSMLEHVEASLRSSGGSALLHSPLGKSFVVTSDAELLRFVLVRGAEFYATADINGLEQHFRASTLTDGQAIWPLAHRLAATFPMDHREVGTHILSCIDASLPPQGGRLDATASADALWGEIQTHVLFGRRAPGIAPLVRAAFETLLGRLQSPLVHLWSSWQKLPLAANRRYRRACAIARQAVAAEIARGPSTEWCMLHTLMAQGGHGRNASDALELCMAFFFNSSATVSSSLAWLLWHVAADGPFQARLRREIDADADSVLSMAKLVAMPHLDAAIAETLRMYTPIHLSRRALRDHRACGRYDIPAGTEFVSNAWLVHRNPTRWRDPHRYGPARFIGTRTPGDTYLPFSRGPRGCPGKRISNGVLKLILARILSRWDMTAEPRHGKDFRRCIIVPTLPRELPVWLTPLARLPHTRS